MLKCHPYSYKVAFSLLIAVYSLGWKWTMWTPFNKKTMNLCGLNALAVHSRCDHASRFKWNLLELCFISVLFQACATCVKKWNVRNVPWNKRTLRDTNVCWGFTMFYSTNSDGVACIWIICYCAASNQVVGGRVCPLKFLVFANILCGNTATCSVVHSILRDLQWRGHQC
jgi:hypothetical protein